MEVVVTTGAIRRAKLQSKCHHQQTNQHPVLFLQARCPSSRPTNSVKAPTGKIVPLLEHWVITIASIILGINRASCVPLSEFVSAVFQCVDG